MTGQGRTTITTESGAEIELPAAAVVCFQSWAGRREIRVTVIAETPRRYRVRYEERLSGNYAGDPGDVRLVPKYAVRFV